jgi:molybdopterin-binding protein
VTLPDGQRINAVVTSGAVDDLDVTVGDDVLVVVKSTEVMLARPSA